MRQHTFAFLRGIERLEDRNCPSVYTWTGLGTNTQWSNPDNWSCPDMGAEYPMENDTANINTNGEVWFDSSAPSTISNVSLSGGGYLNLYKTVTINNFITFNNFDLYTHLSNFSLNLDNCIGTFTGTSQAGVNGYTKGTINVEGESGLYLTDATFSLGWDVNIGAGDAGGNWMTVYGQTTNLNVYNNAQIVINANNTLYLTADNTFSYFTQSDTSTSTITNNGTINVSFSTASFKCLPILNTGTLWIHANSELSIPYNTTNNRSIYQTSGEIDLSDTSNIGGSTLNCYNGCDVIGGDFNVLGYGSSTFKARNTYGLYINDTLWFSDNGSYGVLTISNNSFLRFTNVASVYMNIEGNGEQCNKIVTNNGSYCSLNDATLYIWSYNTRENNTWKLIVTPNDNGVYGDFCQNSYTTNYGYIVDAYYYTITYTA